ncbi:MAG TPA: DUF4388 domain-containing protein [Planctomycetota bacterium]|jgi:hypothetical protein
MAGVPVFVELLQSKETAPLQICRKMMAACFRRKIAPLPFGSSVEEVRSVLSSLRLKGVQPAIFVINCLWAEELLPALDPLIGPTPALLFRRDIFSGGASVDIATAVPMVARQPLSDILRRMSPRPQIVLGYGSRTADAVAEKAAGAMEQYLRDGDFERLLRLSPQSAAYDVALAAARQNLSEFRSALGSDTSTAIAKAVTVPPATAGLPRTAAAAPAAPAGRRAIHGSLEHLALSSLLIMLEMEKKTGELLLTHGDEHARLFLRKGRVLSAVLEGGNAAAELRDGPEAIYYALAWKDGGFDFGQRDIEMEDTVKAPVTALLMEGARRLDESASGSAAN